MNAAYSYLRFVSVLQRSMCPTIQKQARPKTKALPRSDRPGTPRAKGSSLRGVFWVRSGVVGRDAQGCWTGAMQRWTSENVGSTKFGE